MPTLNWTDEYALQPRMDATHHEFIDMLAAVEAALAGPREGLLHRWSALVAHTEAHFAQEDAWMQATGFSAENCHRFQHQAVLQVMRECERRARVAGDFEPIALATQELALWFPQHARMMDAGLAARMAELGFDPDHDGGRAHHDAGAAAVTGGGHACAAAPSAAPAGVSA